MSTARIESRQFVKKISPQKTTKIMTREEIFSAAVDNYRDAFKNRDAYEVLASRLCMAPKTLRAKVAGERHFTVHELELFFHACYFPQGFQMLCDFVFHPDIPKGARK